MYLAVAVSAARQTVSTLNDLFPPSVIFVIPSLLQLNFVEADIVLQCGNDGRA